MKAFSVLVVLLGSMFALSYAGKATKASNAADCTVCVGGECTDCDLCTCGGCDCPDCN